ncbi:hypothetical protein ACJJTC_014917 [Scirpophaga incertulas]
MGCTSSTPKMLPANPNATDNAECRRDVNKITKVDVETMAGEEYWSNGTKVLPSCDTLAEPIKLDSNNKSIDAYNLDLKKDLYIKYFFVDAVKENVPGQVIEHIDDKLSTLEEVVEKVVELYVTDNALKQIGIGHDLELNSDTNLNKELASQLEKKQPLTNTRHSETQEPESDSYDQINNDVEPNSPSQSISSRATRWEALADIAAELPPSLAVDPLTGQIYTLSK